jgi:hypothetical protein
MCYVRESCADAKWWTRELRVEFLGSERGRGSFLVQEQKGQAVCSIFAKKLSLIVMAWKNMTKLFVYQAVSFLINLFHI